MSEQFPWYRFYSVVIRDPKISKIARQMQMDRVTIIGAWAILLTLASDSPRRGRLLLTQDVACVPGDIADVLGWEEQTTKELLGCFVAMEMIHTEDDQLVITNWDKRQFTSDNVSDRVKKHREKRYSNVSETLQDPEVKRFTSVSGSVSDSLIKESLSLSGENFKIYEQEIGPLTPMIAEEIQDAEKEFQPGWIKEAILESAKQDKRSWAYIRAILDRWKKEGYKSRRNGKATEKPDTTLEQEHEQRRSRLLKDVAKYGLEH